MEYQLNFLKIEQNLDQNQLFGHPNAHQPKIKDQDLSYGQWNDRQILKYFLFIHHHKQKFQTKSMRKSLKVFKQMAKFVTTRNSSQCRTHHQNLMNKAKNIQTALQAFISVFPSFYSKYDKIRQSLQILDNMDFCEDTSTVIRKAKQEKKSFQMEMSTGETKQKIHSEEKMPMIGNAGMEVYKEAEIEEMKIRKFMQCQMLFGMWISKLSMLSQLYPY